MPAQKRTGLPRSWVLVMCRACPPAAPTASGRSLDDESERGPSYHRPTPALPADLLGPQGEFGHREHLRLAWRELREHERDVALTRIETAIRHVAEAHGAPKKYHRTITEAWAELVGYHLAEEPALNFEDFLERFPGLLDGALLTRHFSAELLATPAARTTWADPDLRPLPAHM